MSNPHNSMTQQELLSDILSQEKELVMDYACDVTEATCTNLRGLMLNLMSECSSDQYAVFDQMRQRQMYETKKAQQSDVDSTRQKLQQLKQQTGF